VSQNYNAITYTPSVTLTGPGGGGGGNGGGGGDAGNAGKAASTPHAGFDNSSGNPVGGTPRANAAATDGGAGGNGGLGRNGATAGNVSATVTAPAGQDEFTVNGTTDISTRAGGKGGNGGNEGEAASVHLTATAPLGGAGAAGGTGGNAAAVGIDFQFQRVLFNDDITIDAGAGGNGGDGGNPALSHTGTAVRAGAGGAGGTVGLLSLVAENDIVINLAKTVTLKSGDGGTAGLNKTASYGGAGGAAGRGGTSFLDVGRDALVTAGATFNAIKGASLDGGAGYVRANVARNLEIAFGTQFNLNVTGGNMTLNLLNEDFVIFNTLLMWRGAVFNTAAEVYSAANAPTTGHFYRADSLDLVTSARWNSAGLFEPDSAPGPGRDYMRFNMTDISPDALMGDMAGAVSASLARFNPMLQHEAYLGWAGRPLFSDDPANWDYRGTGFFDFPAFLMSGYQTKRLHLGNVTLLDQVNYNSPDPALVTEDVANMRKHYNSSGSAFGPLYDDFAYTAGLRRYYWDVYVQGGAQANQLIAYNYYTADASKIYAQAAAASGIAVNQAFQASMAAIDNAFRHGLVDHYHVEAAFSGSHTRTDTGSHVDVDNWSGALALSRKSENSLGQTIFGIFGEFSTGSYDTFTQVPRYGDLTGDGDVRTYGGGIFLKNLFPTNTVVEASVRGGGFRNEFRLTKDPWILHPGIHNGDTDGTYVGGHIGVAQRIDVADGGQLEAYGRYFLTRTRSDTFRTTFGDEISMDAFTSSRVRVGGRWTQTLPAETVQLYFGLAFEHEFEGKVTGKNGPDPFTHTVETTGSSGFGELGLNINPTDNLTLSVGAFGWAGQQKGVGGNVAVNFSF
jgi:hypothetical protein